MTRIFLNSTQPEVLARMKPEVAEHIRRQQAELKERMSASLPQSGAITLEIGCGHGHYLVAYAEDHPDEFCVGIDLNWERIHRCQRKADRSGLKNLCFIRAEVMEFLAFLPEELFLGKSLMLFPDPWPKKRHFKNRMVQPEFLEVLRRVGGEGHRFYFRSDYEPYWEWTREHIEAAPGWELEPAMDFPEQTQTVFQQLTHNQHYSLVARSDPGEKADQE